MIFYYRERELQLLQEIGEASMESSRMTVMVGRRRIGKTKLLLHATEGRPSAYFLVSRKSESILCRQFSEEAERALGVPIGTYSLFSDLLEHLMRISQNMPFTLIIDEFQELSNINPSIIGDIQRVWDLHKDRSRINLLLSGSVGFSKMKRSRFSPEPPTSSVWIFSAPMCSRGYLRITIPTTRTRICWRYTALPAVCHGMWSC